LGKASGRSRAGGHSPDLTSGVLRQKTESGKVGHHLGILEQSGGIVVRKLAALRL
jgi:hypothetical protein